MNGILVKYHREVLTVSYGIDGQFSSMINTYFLKFHSYEKFREGIHILDSIGQCRHTNLWPLTDIHLDFLQRYICKTYSSYRYIPCTEELVLPMRAPVPCHPLSSLVPCYGSRQGTPLHAVETGRKRHDVSRVDPGLQDVQQLVPVRIAPHVPGRCFQVAVPGRRSDERVRNDS